MFGSVHGVPTHMIDAALEHGNTTEDKAFAFNLLAHIADDDMPLEDIVENIVNGSVPVVVAPKG